MIRPARRKALTFHHLLAHAYGYWIEEKSPELTKHCRQARGAREGDGRRIEEA
jgi:hypothetical protein